MLGVASLGWAQQDSTAHINTGDTVRVGGIIIINKNGNTDGGAIVRDSSGHSHMYWFHSRNKVSTDWLQVDLGFNNYNDNTNYNSAATQALSPGATANRFSLNNGKSVNVNIWFFKQRVSLYRQIINLKYGLGIELYNFRYTNNIIYRQNPLQIVPDTINYRKNKLATDFLTVPLMLNFNFNKNHQNPFGFSVGMSGGYLYSSRQKLVEYGGHKSKIHSDFNLESWRLAYVAEMYVGPIGVYGSLATRSMYKYGLDMTPYAVGIRLNY
jgi:hypothetical protein